MGGGEAQHGFVLEEGGAGRDAQVEGDGRRGVVDDRHGMFNRLSDPERAEPNHLVARVRHLNLR